MHEHITEHKYQRQKKYAIVEVYTPTWLITALLGCDKASNPTAMKHKKKSLLEIHHMHNINNWSTHIHGKGQILARQERQHMEGYSICSNVLMKAQLTITP